MHLTGAVNPEPRVVHHPSIKTESGSKGAAVTAPKMFHVFQKAVK